MDLCICCTKNVHSTIPVSENTRKKDLFLITEYLELKQYYLNILDEKSLVEKSLTQKSDREETEIEFLLLKLG